MSELPVAAGTWQVDPTHSNVEFTVRHLGLSKVRGRFNSFTASLSVGEELSACAISASVDMSSIDTANADRDAHLKSTDFFDVESHPRMEFRSTSITVDDGEYAVTGDLTINGVTRQVEFEGEFNGTETFPMDQSLRAGFGLAGTISRKEFGIEFDVPLGADKAMIGDKVTIEIETQFVAPVAVGA